MERADRFIISPAGALWFGNIVGRGVMDRTGHIGEFIFTIDLSIEIYIFGRL